MAELMGDGADALDSYSAGSILPTIELGRAGIAVHSLAIVDETCQV